MRTSIALVFVLFLCAAGHAADRITATISVTNAPLGNTNKITINSDTRSFTNSVTASPGTLIQQTNSIPWTATNLLNQLTTYRVSQFHFLGSSASTNVRITGAVGEALTVTLAGGWGVVTYTTQTVSSPTFVVRVPMTVEPTSNRTDIASKLVVGISDNATNAFATNATALSNFITKGASPAQTISSKLILQGAIYNGTGNLVFTNIVNYGNAIRSESIGGNSLALGSNAIAGGTRTVAIGNSAQATNTDSMAIGTSALATNTSATAVGVSTVAGQNSAAFGTTAAATGNNSTSIGSSSQATGSGSSAIGNLSQATAAGSIALGQGPTATADYAIAIGNDSTDATGTNAIAIGLNTTASAYRATAVGPGAAASHNFSTAIGGYDNGGTAPGTTTTNEIVLGTANNAIHVPGRIEGTTTTNTTLRGTNVLNGRLDLTSRANSGLANGNNAGVVLGTNVYVRLSGPSASYTINGIAAEQDGSWHICEFANPVNSLIIANQSGTDPTAANRIITGTGADVTFTNNPVVLQFIYNATDARWKIANWFR